MYIKNLIQYNNTCLKYILLTKSYNSYLNLSHIILFQNYTLVSSYLPLYIILYTVVGVLVCYFPVKYFIYFNYPLPTFVLFFHCTCNTPFYIITFRNCFVSFTILYSIIYNMSSLQGCTPSSSYSCPGDIQSTVADFIGQMSLYVQALCSEVVGQAGVFKFKTLVCLQAQTLELQQMRMQISNILAESASLTHTNHLLQNKCSAKDQKIADMEKELSTMEAELRALERIDEQSKEHVNQLQQDVNDCASLLQDQQQQLSTLTKEKVALELEVAQLKQTIHSTLCQDVEVPCISTLSSASISGGVDTSASCISGVDKLSISEGLSLPLPVLNTTTNVWILPPPAPNI